METKMKWLKKNKAIMRVIEKIENNNKDDWKNENNNDGDLKMKH